MKTDDDVFLAMDEYAGNHKVMMKECVEYRNIEIDLSLKRACAKVGGTTREESPALFAAADAARAKPFYGCCICAECKKWRIAHPTEDVA